MAQRWDGHKPHVYGLHLPLHFSPGVPLILSQLMAPPPHLPRPPGSGVAVAHLPVFSVNVISQPLLDTHKNTPLPPPAGRCATSSCRVPYPAANPTLLLRFRTPGPMHTQFIAHRRHSHAHQLPGLASATCVCTPCHSQLLSSTPKPICSQCLSSPAHTHILPSALILPPATPASTSHPHKNTHTQIQTDGRALSELLEQNRWLSNQKNSHLLHKFLPQRSVCFQNTFITRIKSRQDGLI